MFVNIRPTPSPEYIPLKAKSTTPDRMSATNHKGPKRRQKTQASQGDAVLIGFLGGQNNPDIATRAGEEPLNSASQSEAGDQSEGMEDVEGGSAVAEKSSSLVQTAQDALPLIGGTDARADDRSSSPKCDDSRPSLSKIHTQDLNPSKINPAPDPAGLKLGKEASGGQVTSNPRGSDVTNKARHIRGFSPRGSPPPSIRPNHVTTRRRSPPSTTSPLRRFAIPISEGSPMETLPAMHSSPSSSSGKSPKSQQTLPPLHAHFGPLVEGRAPNDSDIRPNGINPPRHTFPLMNGAVHSPPINSIPPRSSQFSTAQARRFPSYPPPQSSPASTYSDASSREPYRQSQDPTSISQPGRFGQSSYHSEGRTPQSDDLTPLSAESYPSAANFSADASPNGDRINTEGRVLPPLGVGSVPLMTGLFKCENAGCTAAPFQTQYLLKSVQVLT
ncbi:hypothetical protein MMC07_002370 [Pseudocyphellaria aurata]|nr:hypothetical protein [Pseudocyphellaria aurata]